MNPSDMNEDEMIALVALSRVMVAVDGALGVEEMEELSEIGQELGIGAFTSASKKVDELNPDKAAAMALAAKVERPSVRELILTMLSDLASSDGKSDDEAAFIEEVRGAWA